VPGDGPGLLGQIGGLSLGWTFEAIDALAAVFILGGVLGQLVYRRLPAGLGASLLAGGTTVGTLIAACHHGWPTPVGLHALARLGAMLCTLWAFFGWLAVNRAAEEAPRRAGLSPAATFFAWALVCGIAVGVLTSYGLVHATFSRLLNPDRVVERLSPSGLWNIIAVLTAAMFWAAAAARRQQPMIVLILSGLLVWWTSLMIPSSVGSYRSVPEVLLPLQPAWWTWTFQLQIGLTVVLCVAAILQERHYRRRQAAAWPDDLDDLLEPYSLWPAFIQSEAVIAAAVLLLGVYHLVREGPPSWALWLVDGGAALAAGVTCMYMTYRRWSGNSAGLGICLLTLAAAAVACALTPVFSRAAVTAEYAVRLPTLCNAMLYALALMVVLWSWLARFWRQQLLHGAAWTTTGQMIPSTLRASYLLTGVAVLIAYQMALWPARVLAGVEDNSVGRIVAGGGALGLLTLISIRNARRLGNSPWAALAATLSVALAAALVLFIFERLPVSAGRGWVRQYNAIVLSAAAAPILIVAEILSRTGWRGFGPPLWWLAMLVLPAAALMGLLDPGRQPAEWVRPATFAVLGALYLLAGRREHRWAILVLASVLIVLAAIAAYQAYGAE